MQPSMTKQELCVVSESTFGVTLTVHTATHGSKFLASRRARLHNKLVRIEHRSKPPLRAMRYTCDSGSHVLGPAGFARARGAVVLNSTSKERNTLYGLEGEAVPPQRGGDTGQSPARIEGEAVPPQRGRDSRQQADHRPSTMPSTVRFEEIELDRASSAHMEPIQEARSGSSLDPLLEQPRAASVSQPCGCRVLSLLAAGR